MKICRCFFTRILPVLLCSLYLLASALTVQGAVSSEELTDLLAPDISDITVGDLFVPAYSDRRSDFLALQLLGLCAGHTQENTSRLFESAYLTVRDQIHFDKEPDDPSHTCAYTIGEGMVMQNVFFPRSAVVVAIRGTNQGEWYSNFDFCPSGREDSLFAENFLYCAEDVFLNLKDYADQDNDCIFLICGHSRGAACANLLGLLMNEYVGEDRVFVYTFACPGTLRSGNPLSECNNIFNYINPCDLIPRLPSRYWGFKRAGQDIILERNDLSLYRIVSRYEAVISQVAPDITSYYTDRHSLTEPGISSEGLTSFEVMLLLSDLLTAAEPEQFDKDSGSDLSLLLSELKEISGNSDLAPLLSIAEELTEDRADLGIRLLHQHLPDVYMELISALLSD